MKVLRLHGIHRKYLRFRFPKLNLNCKRPLRPTLWQLNKKLSKCILHTTDCFTTWMHVRNLFHQGIPNTGTPISRLFSFWISSHLPRKQFPLPHYELWKESNPLFNFVFYLSKTYHSSPIILLIHLGMALLSIWAPHKKISSRYFLRKILLSSNYTIKRREVIL